MIVLRYELTIENFFWYDLNTARGLTEFNKMIEYAKQQLYSDIPLALARNLNRLGNENYEYDKYVIEYKKEPWSYGKLRDEMHRYPITEGKYFFRGILYRRDHFEELVLSKKPFDLYLFVKTMEEYEKEEIEKRYKRSE